MSDKMNEVIQGLNRLERRIGMDGEAVRIQLNSISNCLSDYGPRRRICSFEETRASLSERWGVASSSAEFPLSSLDGYSSGDDESSDPSSGNDEPMTRGRDRQESAEIKGPIDMQSSLSNSCISCPSPADVTANKKSGSSECNVRSDPVPGIGESKTRGRVRRKKVKLEDLKVLRRSPDLLYNVKIGQGQLQLIMEQILFYHIWGLQTFWSSDLNNLMNNPSNSPVISEKQIFR